MSDRTVKIHITIPKELRRDIRKAREKDATFNVSRICTVALRDETRKTLGG